MAVFRLSLVALCCVGWRPYDVRGAEIVVLNETNWDQYAPIGKEADGIYGDVVLRNQKIVVLIATPGRNRHANLSLRNVGGCIIDMTLRENPNDQLGAYFPGGGKYLFTDEKLVRVSADDQAVESWTGESVHGASLTYECSTTIPARLLMIRQQYILRDDQPFVELRTEYRNYSDEPLEEELIDAIRADRTFESGSDASQKWFWVHDDWFRQAYAVTTDDYRIRKDKLLQFVRDDSQVVTIAAQSHLTLVRRLYVAGNLLDLREISEISADRHPDPLQLTIRDLQGPVPNAKVSLRIAGQVWGSGRTDNTGRLDFSVPAESAQLLVQAQGRPDLIVAVPEPQRPRSLELQMEDCGRVVGRVVDANGKPVPCKIAIHELSEVEEWPVDETGKFAPALLRPNLGPDTSDFAVLNLRYSADGTFDQELVPGHYVVLVSHGPEFDLVTKKVEVIAGQKSTLDCRLVRTVDTSGWISADFHSHSSPSGDNTSSQLGRVLNLLCENIEFAPCTEHNRIDSYTPHLRQLGAESLMATCSGIELTGTPLPINHQNAFPLRQRLHTQDGGGPSFDADPELQIRQLALWDDNSEKLVQSNHPNLIQMLSDRDLDGTPDQGFRKMFTWMDVLEIHPLHYLFAPPADPKPGERRIHDWIGLLNQGLRIPGVVNTDSHYNFHGSGWMRNYVRCSSDDPAEIDTLEIVRAAEKGQVVMTTGPFLEATLSAFGSVRPVFGPGDKAQITGGRANLHIKIQCPNWLDVNRVQLFLNGQPSEEHNFTRRSHAARFQDGTVKFESTIELQFDRDTHVIVATIGEGLTLSRVMGPEFGKYAPIAVTNPIYVQVALP